MNDHSGFNHEQSTEIYKDYVNVQVKMKKKPWLIYLLLCLTLTIVFYGYIYGVHTTRLWVIMPTRTVQAYTDTLPTDKLRNTNRSLTVITAFFDIGKFPKGSISNIRTPDKYKSWISVFGRMQNPVVFYTDSEKFATYFRSIRNNCSSGTKVILISRDTLWPFQILPDIAKIYKSPGYPKHYPNTYMPEYTSMTHSKFPVLANATEENFFRTDYFCWLDVGYFRQIVLRKNAFWMEVPLNFNESQIAVTRVYNSSLKNIRAKTIILGNLNWIGGGLFLGKREEILSFTKQYKRAVFKYLKEGIMNVEQHILYSMFTESERKTNPVDVEVQIYVPRVVKGLLSQNPWFYLGFLMYNEKNS